MTAPAIRIENLGKRYIVDHERKQRGGYRTLRESIMDLAAAPLKRLRGESRTTHEEFWALKDVSFEVQPGEVVGIIGRNGAGKSTLLKILSQITKPTKGRVELNGRVGSLLEVGTGFHPELTGRENIYLNGSILGMRKAEIDRKFDEIVDFAEIEQFLDTPVKRYSSGMYVRLAFAVAAHLEPEILIIDEVLAVGDAAFQNKCLGKLGEVAVQGRTVLVVSHQMQLVQSVTKKAFLLEMGNLVDVGSTPHVVQRYLGKSKSRQNLLRMNQRGDGGATFCDLSLTTDESDELVVVNQGDVLSLQFDIDAVRRIPNANLSLSLTNADGVELFSDSWCDQTDEMIAIEQGRHSFRANLPTRYLRPGPYWLALCLVRDQSHVVTMVSGVELPPIIRRQKRKHDLEPNRLGIVYIACEWEKVL